MADDSYSPQEVEVKLAEYRAAQDMLTHYDTLNWQIGSILIGANAVLLGLVVGLLGRVGWLGVLVAVGVSGFSFALLEAWWRWFDRHRAFYNFRNETLQRIEFQLGMYHFLRLVEAEGGKDSDAAAHQLGHARDRAYALPGGTVFEPMYPLSLEGTISGKKIAKWLARGLPVLEFVTLVLVVVAERA